MGGGKEAFDADGEHEAAFDDVFDFAFDGAAISENFGDFFPVLFLSGFLAGEDDHAVFVFEAFEEDFDFFADFEFFEVVEFVDADHAFGFVVDVDDDFVGAAFDDFSFNNRALFKVLEGFSQ